MHRRKNKQGNGRVVVVGCTAPRHDALGLGALLYYYKPASRMITKIHFRPLYSTVPKTGLTVYPRFSHFTFTRVLPALKPKWASPLAHLFGPFTNFIKPLVKIFTSTTSLRCPPGLILPGAKPKWVLPGQGLFG